ETDANARAETKPTLSEDNKPESGGRSRVIRMLGRVLLYGFLILILLAELAPMFFGFIEVTVTLGTGWWFFLKRTVPRIVWNWDLVGMSFVCVVLILMGAQWFLNSIAQGLQRARPLKDSQWRWPWKFTWCGLATVAVFFL